MHIGIIGHGVVGARIAKAYESKGCRVSVYDVVPERSRNTVKEVYSADAVFICVPTPTVDHKQDVSAVYCALDLLLGYKETIIIKSTVLPGTTSLLRSRFPEMRIVHSPEFLNEFGGVEDITRAPQIIVGCDELECEDSLAVFAPFLDHCLIRFMSPRESEMVKYACNVFYSIKNAYFNLLRLACEKHGADFETVRLAAVGNGWIHPMHTFSPGRDGLRGFGGACLPKDLAAFIDFTGFNGSMNQMLKEVESFNEYVRNLPAGTPQKNWEQFFA
jgi:UDPglucose 6-dehydrogenase